MNRVAKADGSLRKARFGRLSDTVLSGYKAVGMSCLYRGGKPLRHPRARASQLEARDSSNQLQLLGLGSGDRHAPGACPTLLPCNPKIVEVGDAVGLGPQSNLAGLAERGIQHLELQAVVFDDFAFFRNAAG